MSGTTPHGVPVASSLGVSVEKLQSDKSLPLAATLLEDTVRCLGIKFEVRDGTRPVIRIAPKSEIVPAASAIASAAQKASYRLITLSAN